MGAILLSGAAPSTIAPVPPAHNAGDILVAVLAGKPTSGTQNVITFSAAGWVIVPSADAQGPAINAGTDVGGTRCTILTNVDEDGSLTGAVTFTITGNTNNAWGVIFALRADSAAYLVNGCNGIDSTGDGTFTAVGNQDPGFEAGDIAIIGCSIPTDIGAGAKFSAETLTATGITTTVTERGEPVQGSGLDSGGLLCSATINTGPSSGAPTFTATSGGTNTNTYGPITIARIRESVVAGGLPIRSRRYASPKMSMPANMPR